MTFGLWHRVAIAGVLLLIALIVMWNIKAPTPSPLISIGIGTIFLLVGGWSLLRGKRSAFIFYALLMLLYFSHAAVTLSTGQERVWAVVELMLSVIVFYACIKAAKIINSAQ